MTQSSLLVGLSHRVASLEDRERAALTPEQAAALSRRLAGGVGEAVCLSTCNRTEVYLASADEGAMEEAAVAALADVSGLPVERVRDLTYRLRGDDVPLHLFRVAAGLDSLVPGEGEILGQVRDAYEQGSPGPLLDRMFRGAIHAGRRVRRETAIREVPASVAGAAAALAEQLFGDLSSCSVLLVGAGKTGELAARSLAARGARIELVANRSPAKAEAVAAQYGGRAVTLERVAALLAEADVVVTSTSARGYVVTRDDVEHALRGRRGRPLFLIDIAVPRDVDPAAHDLDGCFVYDIDDLEAVVVESMPGRAGEAERAEAIAAAEAERFRRWRAAREVAPAIESLRTRAEEIRAGELSRARRRLAGLSEAELAVVEALTTRIVDKLLHVPTVRLKEAAAGSSPRAAAQAFRDLFQLDDDADSRRDAR